MENLKTVILIDGNKGLYIPQIFAKQYNHPKYFKNYNDVVGDLKYLLNENATNNKFYWDSWQNILNIAKFVIDGNIYDLYQDQDLWAIPENYDNDDFFQE